MTGDEGKSREELLAELAALRKELDRMRQDAFSSGPMLDNHILLQALELNPHPLYIKDGSGRYSFVNSALSEALGIPKEELLGKTVEEIPSLPESLRGILATADAEVLQSGKPLHLPELEYRAQDGSRRILEIWKIPLLDQDGNLAGKLGTSIDIAQSRYFTELEDQRRLLQTVFDAIPHDMYVIDRKDVVVMANAAIGESFNLNATHFLGKTLAQSGVYSDSQLEVAASAHREVLKTGQVLHMPRVEVTNRRGAVIYINLIKVPLYDREGEITGILSMSENVSELVSAEQALQKSETNLNHAQRIAKMGSWEVDPISNHVSISREGARIFGMDPDDYPTKVEPYLNRIHPDDQERVRPMFSEVLKSKSGFQVEYRILHDDHSERILSQEVEVVRNPEGRAVSLVGTMLDITERRHMENQWLRAQKMDAIAHLTGGFAHEFNNILQTILGYAQLALGATPSDDPRKFQLDRILSASGKATSLVNYLLGFGRRQLLMPRVMQFQEPLSDMLSMLGQGFGDRMKLVARIQSDLKPIRVDESAMEHVVTNLALNARDAMPEGGTLEVSAENKFLDQDFCAQHFWAREGEFVCLTFQDNGQGMSEAVQERMFEPFFSTKESQQGTGLGLAMVQGVIEQHNGLIRIDSTPGEGTTVQVYLPVAQSGAVAETYDKEAVLLEGMTVLLAEDEPAVQHLTGEMIRNWGCEVIVCSDGQMAVTRFGEHSGRIDLLVLDAVMPRLSGEEVLRHIRALRPDLPVILMSGTEFTGGGDEIQMSQNCISLRKPFREETLREAATLLLKV